ncbi:PREDICTED: uncharacterized protein LOC104742515 [Camelina sativa]|uniref:Uncharacterized protein LOC104742515 n=1 Tax=Camelina sativa TaxID=90675 RepID=A0ABM0VVV1_CAMSA|nr:PREDICTED: uncharacterized protein LOC104742515 [Camelina sativa]
MVLLFVIGYVVIIFEKSLSINKSRIALLMAVSLWAVQSIGASLESIVLEFQHATSEVSQIVFYLLGAMTIVEIIDAHQGFKLVTDYLTSRKPNILLWMIGFATFFLSSVLDNLTTTIVMVSLLKRLVPLSEYRKLLGAVVVIAANAGGAWTPIGDVTTTMLWIHGHISTFSTIKVFFTFFFLIQMIKLIKGLEYANDIDYTFIYVPLAFMSLTSEVNGVGLNNPPTPLLDYDQTAPRGKLVFGVGFGALVFVPIFKSLTGLPPYLGILLGLGVIWILTDVIHYGDLERQHLKLPHALSRIDSQGAFFFLGILLSMSTLDAAGILKVIANYLNAHIPNVELIAVIIGVVSSILDNVPLVSATMGMYNLSTFPQDSEFWQLISLCAGTGGSMLITGSAAGVAFMGMEKVDFFWYFRKVTGYTFLGFTAGIWTYLTVNSFSL